MDYLGKIRVWGLALVVAFMVTAIAAPSASALTWYTRSPEAAFSNGQEEAITPSIRPGTEFILEGKVGTTPLKISAKGLTGEAIRVKQEGTAAKDAGKLIFKELKVVEPATCSPPTEIKSNALKSELVEETALTSGLADRLLPESGEVLANFKLAGTCAIAGTTIQVKTTNGLFAEVEALETFKLEQPLRLSPTINEEAGGNLFTGPNAAKLTGEGLAKLSGTFAGKGWGAKSGSGGTTLCKVEPEELGGDLVCPEGDGFHGEVIGELESGSEAIFEPVEGSEGTVSCDEAAFTGTFNEDGVSPTGGGITAMSFGSNAGPCTSTFPEASEVEIEGVNLPYDNSSIAYLQVGPPQGQMQMAAKNGKPEIRVEAVGKMYACLYVLKSSSVSEIKFGLLTLYTTSKLWKYEKSAPPGHDAECKAKFGNEINEKETKFRLRELGFGKLWFAK